MPRQPLLLFAFAALASGAQWHEGCLCELKPTPAASRSDLAMNAIFGTAFFRQGSRVAQFCPCSIETVQQLNRELIMPRLLPLLNRTFFRYAQINLDRPCPFWDDSHGSCALRDCAVDACSEDEEQRLASCSEEQALGLGDVQRTDEGVVGAAAPSWDLTSSSWTLPLADPASAPGGALAAVAERPTDWDEEEDGVWEPPAPPDATAEAAQFVDLVDNPEQYTGYSAAAGASRVWEEWHAHNSFAPPAAGCAAGASSASATAAALPVEMRLFSRLTSGIHASVSSHICANYLLDRRANLWGLEIDEYERRLGAHPERLNNLHFAYLTVLRALELASSHLAETFAFSTGMPREDAAVAREVRELLSSQPEWPLTFDEQRAFVGVRCPSTLVARHLLGDAATCSADEVAVRTGLLRAFRDRLHNISRLMDCVGCGRCRLWGKLQVHGLATALRVLYAPDRNAVLASLRRSDVVALFNLLGRLSHSVEVARVVVPLLGAAHSTCSPRGCKASEYVVADDDDELPGTRGDGGGAGFDPITQSFG